MSSQPILFIQTAFVGDLLLSIPTLRALRADFPNARTTLLCRKGLGDFMTRAGVVDEVIEADKSSGENWSQIVASLKSVKWFRIFCPHQSPRSLLLVQALKSDLKIGYRNLLGKFVFDEAIDRPMHLPEALRQMVLIPSKRRAELYSYESPSNKNVDRRMPRSIDRKSASRIEKLNEVPGWASMKVPELKAERKAIVVLAPGSVWTTKKWTEEGFTEVAAHYSAQGKTVYLVGSADEKEICERVRVSALARSPNSNVVNSAGSFSLWQSAQLMASAELVVTNDSGAMHMAACADTPTVSIFGPTVLEQGYRPWQSNARVVHSILSCRPCGKHGSRKCPIGTHECMKLIPASSVISAAKEL